MMRDNQRPPHRRTRLSRLFVQVCSYFVRINVPPSRASRLVALSGYLGWLGSLAISRATKEIAVHRATPPITLPTITTAMSREG